MDLKKWYVNDMQTSAMFKVYKGIKQYLNRVGGYDHAEFQRLWNGTLDELWDLTNELEDAIREGLALEWED